MFAGQQIFQDSKENVKSVLPLKTNINSSRKGLKPCSLNNFADSTNRLKSKKSVSENKPSYDKFSLGEKENSKPKVKVQEKKTSHETQDSWSDIEEMHIYIESDDDYEDILPNCERIQREDVNNLFLDFSSVKYADFSDEEPPSPIKVFNELDIPDFSPPLLEMSVPTFDDFGLDFIPLPDCVI